MKTFRITKINDKWEFTIINGKGRVIYHKTFNTYKKAILMLIEAIELEYGKSKS